jgi:WD40 repeat protein
MKTDHIQGFETVRVIGEGSFGRVLEAVDPKHPDQHVAIKVLHPDLAKDPEVSSRFLQEGLILARLDHPAIPRVQQVSPWKESFFIVMDLVEGISLADSIAELPLEIPPALDQLDQLLDALEYAHRRGVLHRDLKPSNIVITDHGLKILDFGISKLVGAMSLTPPHSFLGTVIYASPEQMAGGELDGRADLFSLGIMLHEMITGHLPHEPGKSERWQALAKQFEWVHSGPRDTLRTHLPDVPEWLEHFFAKLTAPDRDDRFPDARAARLALREGRRSQRIELSKSDFKGVDLRGRALAGADLGWADLRGANLAGMDLTETDLRGARLADAVMTGAKLAGANLDGADLTDASLMGADLVGATITATTRFYRTRLVGARLDPGVLAGRDISGSAPPDGDGVSPVVFTASHVLALAFSPEGTLLCTGHRDGTVRLWDPIARRGIRHCHGHRGQVFTVAFSPDGELVASGSADQTARVWHVDSGANKLIFDQHDGRVDGVVFSPDGRLLVTASHDRLVRVWDLPEGRLRHSLAGHERFVACVAFSPDGRLLASASGDGTVALWSLETGERIAVLAGHERSVDSVSFSPDGRLLASASGDKRIHIWDVERKQRTRVLEGHESMVQSVAFNVRGTALVSASPGSAILWSVVSGTPRAVLSGRGRLGRGSAAFSPDGYMVAVGRSDQVVLENATGDRELGTLSGRAREVTSVIAHGDRIIAATDTGSLWIWDAATGRALHRLPGHTDKVTCLTSSPDASVLASASKDTTVRLWHAETGDPSHVLTGHLFPVTCAAFSPDGSVLATGSNDKTLRVWDPVTRSVRHVLEGHASPIKAVCFEPSEPALVSVAADHSVRYWNPETGALLQERRAPGRKPTCVVPSPDGRYTASGFADGAIELWRTVSTRPVVRLEGRGSPVTALAFGPSGSVLASGCAGQPIRLWKVPAGEPLREIPGQWQDVIALAFDGSGTHLVSSAGDGAARVWDTASGATLISLVHFEDGWAALAPDGRYKHGGNLGASLWWVIGLCRFEPGELDLHLDHICRVPDQDVIV